MIRSYRAVDVVFSVHATHPPLQVLVDELYAPCATEAPASVRYTIVERGGDTDRSIAIFEDDRRVETVAERSVALAYLVWRVGQRAIAEAGNDRLLLHAAAAELDGAAVLLSAPSGSGKSTLVAGLVAAGFGYLTDDLAPFDIAANRVQPYPKPIAIAPEALDLFTAARPAPNAREYLATEAFLTAAALGSSAGVESEARLVVVPEYRAGRATEVEDLSRAAALVLLAEQSFNFTSFGAPAMHALATMLARCQCVRLRYGSLADAVATIAALVPHE